MRPFVAIERSTAITLGLGALVLAGLALGSLEHKDAAPAPIHATQPMPLPQPPVIATPPVVQVPQVPIEVTCCACAMEDNRLREQHLKEHVGR